MLGPLRWDLCSSKRSWRRSGAGSTVAPDGSLRRSPDAARRIASSWEATVDAKTKVVRDRGRWVFKQFDAGPFTLPQ
jgi:hypothetical protein